MRIRPGVPDDAEAIERIRIRGWQTAYRDVFPGDELDRMILDATRWREQLSSATPTQACFVCEHDGRIAGWVTIGQSAEHRIGELHGLYVDPDAWATGVAVALIEIAEEELARDYDEAVLWVLEANDRARRFYERAGWTPDGVRGSFDRFGTTATVVRYRKRLSSSASHS